ncbi:MAG: cupin domain-containing protein [Ruminococcus sp.]|nr:cupin domain-containing protein [Ruminococcus sp.]
MEFIKSEDIKGLANPGVVSRQLLNPDNSESRRVTITEVHLEIGACQPRHTHDASEQIWYATKGCGKLLLANDTEKELGQAMLFVLPIRMFMDFLTMVILNLYIFQ